MKVKMLKKELGSQDGVLVQEFKEGEIYDIAESLARVFVDVMNVAVYSQEEIVEKKMAPAPENKMASVESVSNKDADEIKVEEIANTSKAKGRK